RCHREAPGGPQRPKRPARPRPSPKRSKASPRMISTQMTTAGSAGSTIPHGKATNMSKFLPQTGTLKIQYNTQKTIESVNKKALFESIFIDTPFHSKLFSQLDALRLQGLVSKGVCHRALLCLAPPATGKTSVAERY